METTPGSCEAVQSLFLLGSCPVRVRVRVRLVSGFASGSRPGSCPASCLVSVWVRVGFVSGACPVRVWFVSGLASGSHLGSCPVRVSGSCLVRVRFVSGSCPDRVWFGSGRVWFESGLYLDSTISSSIRICHILFLLWESSILRKDRLVGSSAASYSVLLR